MHLERQLGAMLEQAMRMRPGMCLPGAADVRCQRCRHLEVHTLGELRPGRRQLACACHAASCVCHLHRFRHTHTHAHTQSHKDSHSHSHTLMRSLFHVFARVTAVRAYVQLHEFNFVFASLRHMLNTRVGESNRLAQCMLPCTAPTLA